nr:MAG: non-structural polyprotein [Pseudoscorpian dicistrovirus 2]
MVTNNNKKRFTSPRKEMRKHNLNENNTINKTVKDVEAVTINKASNQITKIDDKLIRSLSRSNVKLEKEIKRLREFQDNVFDKNMSHKRDQRSKQQDRSRQQQRLLKKNTELSAIKVAQICDSLSDLKFDRQIGLPNLTQALTGINGDAIIENLARFNDTSENLVGVLTDATNNLTDSDGKLRILHDMDEDTKAAISKLNDTLASFVSKIPDDISKAVDKSIDNLTVKISSVVTYVLVFMLIGILLRRASLGNRKLLGLIAVICLLLFFGADRTFVDLIRPQLSAFMTYVVNRYNDLPSEEEETSSNVESMDRHMSDDLITETSNMAMVAMFALVMGKTPKGDKLDKFLRTVGMLPRAMEGTTSIAAHISKWVQQAMNFFRVEIFGLESITLTETGVREVDEYVQGCTEVYDLERKSKLLVSQSNAEKIYKLWLEGRKLLATFAKPVHVKLRVLIQENHKVMDKLQTKFKNSGLNVQGDRQAPIILMLTGPTGVGKSFIAKRIVADLQAFTLPEHDLPHFQENPDNFVFTYNPENEYADGYNGQPATILDETGAIRDTVGRTDSEFLSILRMGNPFGYPMHMASLEEKGVVFFKSTFVLCTSNMIPTLTSIQSLTNAEAVLRRIDFPVRVTVKQEYAKLYKKSGSITEATDRMVDTTLIDWTKANFDHLTFEVLDIKGSTPEVVKRCTYQELLTSLVVAWRSEEKNYNTSRSNMKTHISNLIRLRQEGRDCEIPNFYESMDRQSGLTRNQFDTLRNIGAFSEASPEDHVRINDNSEVWFSRAPPLPPTGRSTPYEEDDDDDGIDEIPDEAFRDLLRSTSCASEGTELRSALVRLQRMLNFRSYNIYMLLWHIFKSSSRLRNLVRDSPLDEEPLITQQRLLDALLAYTRHYLLFSETQARAHLEGQLVIRLTNRWTRFRDSAIDALTRLKDGVMAFIRERIINSPGFARVTDFLSRWWNEPLVQITVVTIIAYVASISIVVGIMNLMSYIFSFGRKHKSKEERVAEQLHHLKNLQERDELLRRHPILDHQSDPKVRVPLRNKEWMKKKVEITRQSDPSVRVKMSTKEMTAARIKAMHPQANLDEPLESTRILPDHLDKQMGSIDKTCNQILKNLVCKNMYEIEFKEGSRAGLVLFLKGRLALMPKHFIAQLLDWVSETENGELTLRAKEMLRLNARLKSVHTKDQIFHVPFDHLVSNWNITDAFETRDLCVVEFPDTFPARPDITKFFVSKKTLEKPRDKHFILINPSANWDDPFRDKIWIGSNYRNIKLHPVGTGIDEELISEAYFYAADVDSGDCGALMALIDPSTGCEKIIGMHIGGKTSARVGMSAAFNKEEILEAVDAFQDQIEVLEPEDSIITSDCGLGFERNHSESLVPSGFMSYALSDKPLHVPGVSQIQKSLLHNTYSRAVKAPAVLRPVQRDGETIDPYVTQMVRLNRINIPLPVEKFDDVSEELYNHLCRTAKRNDGLRVFTFEEAVLGLEGDPYFASIKRGTSAGFPYNITQQIKNKKPFFGFGDDFEFHSSQCFKLRKNVEQIIEDAKLGKRNLHVFSDCLKDELRPLEKVKIAKTRVFSASPVDYYIVCRMYFGDFSRFMVENHINNGCAVGMNVLDDDWHKLYTNLQSKGRKVFAGDYSAFDGSQCPEIFVQLRDMINRFYRDSDPSDNIVRNILFEDLMFSKHITGNTVYEWIKSLPSGHFLTITINCLYNLFAFLYCWYYLTDWYRDGLSLFWEHVYIIVGGDDNAVNVSDQAIDWFNQVTVMGAMATIDLTYTDENKGDVMLPYREISEITFFKRAFRFEKLIQRYVGPLSMETILEMPQWTNKTAMKDQVVHERVEACLNELSLHGREIYEQWAPKIIEQYKLHYSRNVHFYTWLSTFRTYHGSEALLQL